MEFNLYLLSDNHIVMSKNKKKLFMKKKNISIYMIYIIKKNCKILLSTGNAIVRAITWIWIVDNPTFSILIDTAISIK